MQHLNIDQADAVVRVPLRGEFTFEQVRDMVRAVCDNTAEHTRFFETTMTDGQTGRAFPAIGQHSIDPAKNLFVGPGPNGTTYRPEEPVSQLVVVAHELAEYGQVVHANNVYPEDRARAAGELAGHLYRAFDKGINDFQAARLREARLYQQDQAVGSPAQARPGTDGARERPAGPGAGPGNGLRR
jgi:hypothetical protein